MSPAEHWRYLIDLTRKFWKSEQIPKIDEVFIETENQLDLLHEGKWVSGRFNRNIRIDTPNYGAGKEHAHVLGRRGDQIGVVNIDGTSSHGTKCKLHPADVEALRSRGFDIRDDGIVEWVFLESGLRFLMG